MKRRIEPCFEKVYFGMSSAMDRNYVPVLDQTTRPLQYWGQRILPALKRERDSHRERQADRQRQRERQTDRQSNRQTQTERERDSNSNSEPSFYKDFIVGSLKYV